jgi:hypothetical protein
MTPQNWWTGETAALFNKADLAGFHVKEPTGWVDMAMKEAVMVDVAWRLKESLDCIMDIRLLDVVETVQKRKPNGLMAAIQLGNMSQDQLMAAIGELEAMIEKSSVVALSLHEATQQLGNALSELEGA